MGLEAAEANLEGQGPPGDPLLPCRGGDLGRQVAQGAAQHRGVGDILGEGGLLGEGLARARRADPVGGDPARLLVETGGGSGPEMGLELRQRPLAQVRHGAQSQPLQPGQGLGTDAAQDADRLGTQKVQDLLRGDHDQAVRLVEIRGDLGHQPVRADAHRGGQSDRGLDGVLDPPADGLGRADQETQPADVQKGLVDGDRLHHRGIGGHDGLNPAGDLAVMRHARAQVDRIRTAAVGLGDGHGRADAEAPRLVGAGGHHPAPAGLGADHHRPAAQRRVVALLHGGVEGVHVQVHDPARGPGAHGRGVRQGRASGKVNTRAGGARTDSALSIPDGGRPAGAIVERIRGA